jgi:hypothetical protein
MPPEEIKEETTEPAEVENSTPEEVKTAPEIIHEPAEPIDLEVPEVGLREPVPVPLEDAHQGDSLGIDLNPAENVTEIHTRPTESFGQAPETVTITEVMEPEGTKMPMVPDARSFLKSFLPKLKEKLAGRTEKRLAKILDLARAKSSKGETIQNDDVEKLLHVSDTSATNYLNKLVQRGSLHVSGQKNHLKYLPA